MNDRCVFAKAAAAAAGATKSIYFFVLYTQSRESKIRILGKNFPYAGLHSCFVYIYKCLLVPLGCTNFFFSCSSSFLPRFRILLPQQHQQICKHMIMIFAARSRLKTHSCVKEFASGCSRNHLCPIST